MLDILAHDMMRISGKTVQLVVSRRGTTVEEERKTWLIGNTIILLY